MEQRKVEIDFALNMIQTICEDAEITLIAKEIKKGTLAIVIVDAKSGKEYVIKRDKERR